VVSLYQDRGGVVWVGTRSAGLSRWNPRAWSFGHYKPEARAAGSEAVNVTSFAQDASGRLWIGSFGAGLLYMDRASGGQRRYRHDEHDAFSLSDDRVMALLVDRAGSVWVGTMGGGLDKLDSSGRIIARYRHDDGDPNSLGADAVMALYEDLRGRAEASCATRRTRPIPPRSRAAERRRSRRTPRAACGSARTAAVSTCSTRAPRRGAIIGTIRAPNAA
jgi:ligand-binding sensor domain-containing protein